MTTSCQVVTVTKSPKYLKSWNTSKQTDHLWFKRNRSLGIQMFDQPMTHFFWVKRWLIDFWPFNKLVIYQFYFPHYQFLKMLIIDHSNTIIHSQRTLSPS